MGREMEKEMGREMELMIKMISVQKHEGVLWKIME
jgi:hypothetical protein